MNAPPSLSSGPSASLGGCPLNIHTRDGIELAARIYEPQVGTAVASVLIAPAMGVPQSYYRAVAQWLASRGVLVMSFDYRGMGLSRRGSLQNLDADILTWAEEDCSAALALLRSRSEGLPTHWIGHSLGGQILPFVRGREALTHVITVASGTGYWRENAAPTRRVAWLLWYLVAPVTTSIFGYFPGGRLGIVGDLPRYVMNQWRSWCLDPDYLVGVLGEEARQRFAQVRTPITSISFADDEMMSGTNIRRLHDFYLNAPREMIRLRPKQEGQPRIGHFGFFKRNREDLWQAHLAPALGLARN